MCSYFFAFADKGEKVNSIRRFCEAASCNSIAIRCNIKQYFVARKVKVARSNLAPSLISRILEQPLEAPVPTFAGLLGNPRPIVKSVCARLRESCNVAARGILCVRRLSIYTRAFAKVLTRDRSLYHIKAHKTTAVNTGERACECVIYVCMRACVY